MSDAYRSVHADAFHALEEDVQWRSAPNDNGRVTYFRFIKAPNSEYLVEQYRAQPGIYDSAEPPILSFARVFAVGDDWYGVHLVAPFGWQSYLLIRREGGTLKILNFREESDAVTFLGRSHGLTIAHESGEVRIADADEKRIRGFLTDLSRLEVKPMREYTRVTVEDLRQRESAFMSESSLGLVSQLETTHLSGGSRLRALLEYYERLHETGIGAGSYALSRFYVNGWAVPRDSRRGLELARLAVKRGVVHANAVIGAVHFWELDGGEGAGAAIPYLLAAHEVRDPRAAYLLGLAYRDGSGMARDVQRARTYLQEAAKGLPAASSALAALLLNEGGGALDDEALAVLNEGIRLGHAGAHEMKGWMYENGRAGPVNIAAAREEYETGLLKGDSRALYRLARTMLTETSPSVRNAAGITWMRLAAALGHTEALAYIRQAGLEPTIMLDDLMRSDAMYFDTERHDYGTAISYGLEGLEGSDFSGPTPLIAPGAQTVFTQQLKSMLDGRNDVRVIDVRRNAESSLPGAVAMPSLLHALNRSARERIAHVNRVLGPVIGNDKSAPLVFMCINSECWMSYYAAMLAAEAGYENVFWYRGGIYSWRAAGYPLGRID